MWVTLKMDAVWSLYGFTTQRTTSGIFIAVRTLDLALPDFTAFS